MSQYMAYVHATPDGRVFYVGKGTERRSRDFCSNRNKHYRNTVAQFSPEKPLVGRLDVSNEATAFMLEIGLIKCFRRNGVSLTNKTDGGEGRSGFPTTPETKRKISAKLKGRVVSEATRKAMSKAQRGKVVSEASKSKMRAVDRSYLHERTGFAHPLYGKHHSEEARRKISVALSSKEKTDSHKAAIAAALTGVPKQRVICEQCGASVDVGNYSRWHGDACRHKGQGA